MRIRRSVRCALAALCAAVLVSSGCARFNDAQSQPFTTNPELKPQPSSTPPPPPPLPPTPFPKACPAPGVMQGCLESTSGLIMGVDSKTALVAERTTGAVKEISVSAEPKVKMVIPVDPSGDGGLMDIVLSPTYTQDRLMYAYISTPTDNRVIRIADGDIPKDILTGIPKGATGNTGALIFTSPTTLVVLTGDAGNPAHGRRSQIVGRQGAAHRAADHHRPGAADDGAVRHRLRRRPVHRSRRRLAVCRRPHPQRGPVAAHHQEIGGLHGVDLAGQARRGRLRGHGRHRCWST